MSSLNRFKRRGMIALAVASLFLGVSSTGWMLLVVHQWALPWTSFKIFLPDPRYMQAQKSMAGAAGPEAAPAEQPPVHAPTQGAPK